MLSIKPALKRVACVNSFAENLFLLCKWVSIGDGFLVSSGSLCPLLTLSTGSPSGLSQYRSCVCCHSFCELICCVWKTLLPWCSPSSWALLVFLHPLSRGSLSPWGGDSIETYHLRWGVPKCLLEKERDRYRCRCNCRYR